MASTFTTEKRTNHAPRCAYEGCHPDSLCTYFVAVQLPGDGRTSGFLAVRSNGDAAVFKSRSGARQYGLRYFGA